MTERAIKLSNHAATLIGSKNRKTALALLKRASSLSDLAGIKTNLAIAHTTLGNYAEASEILYNQVHKDNDDLAAWHAYGVLSLVAGLPADAIECFKKVHYPRSY
jgi:tetratricopeptide (TPR) repeat protein